MRGDPDPTPGKTLLEPEFLRRLERLELSARKVMSGERRGDVTTRRRGGGTQFREHRGYVPGDDPRFLDWNAFLRLGDLVVKEFDAEETPRLAIFLDRSGSMALGGGEKLWMAQRLAAALGYVGLCRHASVGCVPFPGDGHVPFFRGRAAVPRFLDGLASLEPGGETVLLRAFKGACPPGRPTGLAVVMSDFFETVEYRKALQFLNRRGFAVHALHLVSGTDQEPPASGWLEIKDTETGRVLRERITPRLADAYCEAVQQHFREVEQTCRELQVAYHRIPTSAQVEHTVLTLLRQGALVR